MLGSETVLSNNMLDNLVIAGVEATLIFYAPPHSLAAILDDMAATLGGSRRCVVAREMTKVRLCASLICKERVPMLPIC